MQKLLNGIREFRRQVRPSYIDRFSKLALGQKPDCLFISCSDSRVVPNLFASTDPGDLFVVRNVGNIVPPAGEDGYSILDRSEAAAIEFALEALQVRDIIVCGHSECGAMQAVLSGKAEFPNLKEWLGLGQAALNRLERHQLTEGLAPHNRLSQVNVLQQLDHLLSYPIVQRRIAEGKLGLHAWWFDLAHVEVSIYQAEQDRFVPVLEEPTSSTA